MNSGQAENSRKLKVLITLLYYYPHPTGLTYYVQMFAEELARRGHQVTVLASRHDKALPKEPETHNGVRIVRVWAPVRLSRGMILPSYPWHLLRLMRQHDIVSIHTPMLETALVSVLAGFAGLKVIPTHHGDLFLPEGLLNKAIVKMMYAMYAFMARRAPCIIGFSDDYAENSYYLRPFRDKLAVVYPPISIQDPNLENAARLRRKWQCDDGPLIGFAGRFAHEKRPDLLIKALEVINRKYPKTRIIFAGEYNLNYENTWNLQKELVEQYKSQLIFLGLIRDKQQMADFYAACDVLVLPSNNDCFPAVLGESMLCGTPVVMTDVYGGRVPVLLTGMGKLAKSGDWQSIGRTTLEVLDNRDKYIKPKDFVAKRFSLQDTFDRFESVLLEHARK
ncbi:MAG: glycosyltransferase family 4 protein [Chloroflexota bacterium]|nr:glycosyltransferase family 4 protein [Chloroflexota bacterium]